MSKFVRKKYYPGLPKESRKAIWDLPKDWNPNYAEGEDACRRGYARDSHFYGDCAAAKEFEAGWDREYKKLSTKST